MEMDMSAEIQSVRDVLLAGYEVSMFSMLIARPLEDGRYACDIEGIFSVNCEDIMATAELAAEWLVTTRHARKLGMEYEREP